MLNGGCNALIVRWLCGIAENRVFAPNIFLVQKKCVVFNIDCWALMLQFKEFFKLYDIQLSRYLLLC